MILSQEGVSDEKLAKKIAELLDANSTHYFSHEKDGELEILEHQSPALETQRKTAELVAKLKGHLREQATVDVRVGLMALVVQAVREEETEE